MTGKIDSDNDGKMTGDDDLSKFKESWQEYDPEITAETRPEDR